MDISSVNTKIMPALKSRTMFIVAAAVVAGAVGSKMLWSDSASALKVPVASATTKAPPDNSKPAPRASSAVAAVNGVKQGSRAPMAKPAASAVATAQQSAAAQAAVQAQIAQAQADAQNQAQTVDQQQQFQAQPQQRPQLVAAAPADEDAAPIAARSTRVAAPALSAVRHNPSEVDSSSDTEGLFVISSLKAAPAVDAATPSAAAAETRQPAPAAMNNNNVVVSDAANNALGERVITAAAAPAAPGSVTDGLGPVFVDDANSYYMRFPAAWSIRKFDGEPWVVECGDGKSALISVGFSAFPAEYTADDINLDWVSRRIKKRPDTTLNAQGYATIMNRKAVWSKSTGPMQMGANNIRVVRTTYILPLGDGRVAEIRIAAAPETYEKISGVMKNAVSTFRLVPKRAPDTTVAKLELSQ